MPRAYEAMKEKFLESGMSLKNAKTKAAKIYNSKRAANPSLPKLSNKHKSTKKK